MASAHIEITGTSRTNRQLRALLDNLQGVVDDANSLKAGFDQMALGGDFEALAQRLDLRDGEDWDEATAETLYNLLGSVVATLNDPNSFITQLLSRTH